MRIVEFADITSTGRVRRNNEDSHLAAPPLFVVADGMGGAQAGELASRMCIEAFQELPPGGTAPERLAATIVEANRRVVERARSDPSTAGMGSTVTAALVDGGSVAFGHVGDSRAYLLRRGSLQQISHDHSLVGELVRQGRITPEEAETHPQRSVITRVVGAGPSIEVDTWSIEAEDGDVYLLCSDGLTGLVDDERLATTLGRAAPLRRSLAELVRQANDAGGDDNITAVAFRLGETAPVEGGGEDGRDEQAADAPGEDTLTEADRVPVVTDEQLAERELRVGDTVIGQALPPRPAPAPAAPAPQARPEPQPMPHHGILAEQLAEQERARSSVLRPLLIVLVVLILAAGAVVGSIVGLRWSHFVGVDPRTGKIAVYQGVPFELTGSHTLYREIYSSPDLYATELTARERKALLDHKLQSKADALARVRALEAKLP